MLVGILANIESNKEFYRTTTNVYICGTTNEYMRGTFRATRKARLQAYRKIMCETMKLIEDNFINEKVEEND